MFSIIKPKFIIPLLILFTKFQIIIAVDDDDDNILGEIVVDLLVGAGISICESFVFCKLMMLFVGFISLIAVLIGICSGEIGCEDICNSRNARRSFTSGVGYGVTRSFRR
uniref:Uncharacterized protein n=1 Tax=viral metagenome TaxID=1070528 RepID=A0A6C0EPR1_9ZZZZ